MGNTQASDKQSKTGKSPAKSKNFIRNLNRKSQGRESKKHGRKKSDAKRDAIDREFDKTPDSDNVEVIETSDNDTVECSLRTALGGEGEERSQSEVTVSRCGRSPTRRRSRSPPPRVSPQDPSTSESVFTEPLTPLAAAVELNQCYYSAESDSAPEEAPAPPPPAPSQLGCLPDADMPHDNAASLLTTNTDKDDNKYVFDDNSDSAADKDENNENDMGALISWIRSKPGPKDSHDCDHDFADNRLKASPGQTSFKVSKHRRVELPRVDCDSLLLGNESGKF